MGKGGMKGLAKQMMGGPGGMGAMPAMGGAGMPDAAEAEKMLSQMGGGSGGGSDGVDFDAIEKALAGKGALPPGMGGLPGFGKKK